MSNETIHQINVTKYFISLPEGDYDFQEHLTDYLLTDILNANKQINKLETRVKELEQKLNAQFAEMEEKLTAEENKNFELKENIKTIFTSLIIANHVDIGTIQDTIWIDNYTTLWDYIRIVLNMDDKQFEEFEKQALKHIEYYVVYYKDNRRCSSKNFLNKCEAEDYAQSMSKNGFTRIEVCTYIY